MRPGSRRDSHMWLRKSRRRTPPPRHADDFIIILLDARRQTGCNRTAGGAASKGQSQWRPVALAGAVNATDRLKRRLIQADSAGALHAAFPGTRRHPWDGGKAAIRGEESQIWRVIGFR